ncbi:MAG TPA: hypothetical protein VHV10_20225 [Ktedonobacteraceae bacterium]|nr:hypothetical protein [Ktedonobacteraceae bacterium]
MMEDSPEKHAQSVQHASRMRLLRSLLGLRTQRQAGQELEASGSKSEDGERVKDFFGHVNEIAKDELLHLPVHRFLMSGLIVIDLMVLQTLISLGRLDLPATLGLIALSIALPTAAGSLFLGWVQQRNKIETDDWSVIGYLSAVSGGAGLIGITGALWHATPWAGSVFVITALIMVYVCGRSPVRTSRRTEQPRQDVMIQATSTSNAENEVGDRWASPASNLDLDPIVTPPAEASASPPEGLSEAESLSSGEMPQEMSTYHASGEASGAAGDAPQEEQATATKKRTRKKTRSDPASSAQVRAELSEPRAERADSAGEDVEPSSH